MMPSSYTEANPFSFEGQALFALEGVLSELQTAWTTINLLEQIDSNIKAKSLVAGASAMLGGMHGLVANSTAIALYDGEETYHFAGVLDGQVICGTFQHADKIQNGNHVRAVVSKRGNVLFAHSILNMKKQEFYMPMNVFSSGDGLFGHCMRVAWRLTWVGWAISACIAMFSSVFSLPNMSNGERVGLASMLFLLPPAIMFPFELWTYSSMRGAKSGAGGSYGGAIFEVLGFADPEKIDLMRHSELSNDSNGGWYAVGAPKNC